MWGYDEIVPSVGLGVAGHIRKPVDGRERRCRARLGGGGGLLSGRPSVVGLQPAVTSAAARTRTRDAIVINMPPVRGYRSSESDRCSCRTDSIASVRHRRHSRPTTETGNPVGARLVGNQLRRRPGRAVDRGAGVDLSGVIGEGQKRLVVVEVHAGLTDTSRDRRALYDRRAGYRVLAESKPLPFQY